MAEAAERLDSLRGVHIRRSTDWSETMLLALGILMTHKAVQKHGLRPSRIALVPPHEGRYQLRCPVHRGVIEKQPLRGNILSVNAMIISRKHFFWLTVLKYSEQVPSSAPAGLW